MGVIKPPPLIEPITVTVSQVDESSTQYSGGLSGRHETVNSVVRKDVSFQAQVVFGNTQQDTDFSQFGADENTGGYLVVRRQDLKDASIDLKRGDKITKLGDQEVELYLLHGLNKPAAQFTSLGTFTLERVFFADRKPGS